MSERKHIIDGKNAVGKRFGLIYTKKCGWIDLGHAHPDSATLLWSRIGSEIGKKVDGGNYFLVDYGQRMGRKMIGYIGVRKKFRIKTNLTLAQRKSVTLGIILGVSTKFEELQANWLFKHFIDSGFSAEDLVSNLIGFYRAINPGVDYITMCEPVSQDIALEIWDKYGAVGSNKNRSIFPYLYPIDPMDQSRPRSGFLPPQLNTVKPAQLGLLYQEVR